MEKGYLLQIARMARPKKEKRKKRKKKERKKKTVHEDNPRQTYKMIYGLIKQGNLKAKLHYWSIKFTL